MTILSCNVGYQTDQAASDEDSEDRADDADYCDVKVDCEWIVQVFSDLPGFLWNFSVTKSRFSEKHNFGTVISIFNTIFFEEMDFLCT